MREYIIKRVIIAFFTLYIVLSLNFIIFQVLNPVNPAKTILSPGFKPEMRRALEEQYGIYEEIHIRYVKYIANLFTWQFGWSFVSRESVAETMAWRLSNTVTLLGTVLIGTIVIGIPLGVLAASRRGSKPDVFVIGTGLFTWAMPIFFIELLFMLVFSYYLGVWFGWHFPTSGVHSNPIPREPLAYIADLAFHMAVPATALILGGFGSWALYTRNLLLDAMTQDFVTTARAKGASERTVLYRHAFRSTLPPIVTMITLSVPGIVVGAMITEYIFTWPGIGRWYLDAMQAGDFPVVQAVLYVYSILTILANFIADILYGILDPRIRVGMRR